jgi:hypothetical protein
MAKAVADVRGGEAAAGFVSDDSPILGFSHLHDSGTYCKLTLDLRHTNGETDIQVLVV